MNFPTTIVVLLLSVSIVHAKAVIPPVEFAPDDVQLIAASNATVAGIWPDGRLGIWNLDKSTLVSQFPLFTSAEERAFNFVLSDDSSHLAAIEYAVGDVDKRLQYITVVDYEAKAIKWKVNVFDVGINYIMGFSADGRNLICCTNAKIYTMDVGTGSMKCLVSFTDLLNENGRYVKAMQASRDGKYSCIIFNDRAYIRDASGKDLWNTQLDLKTEDRGFDLLSDHVVVLNGMTNKIEFRDFADGHLLASIQPVDLSKVVSVAAWKDQTALASDGKAEVQIGKQNEPVVLDGINMACEVMFTADGNRVLCLPSRQWKMTQSNNRSILHVYRASDTVKIFNAQTGKLDRELNLVLPATAAATRGSSETRPSATATSP